MTTTPSKLSLADRSTWEDLRSYLQRLARVGEPEVRVQTRGAVLAVYGCTQAPAGLLDSTPVVLGMRAFALGAAPETPIDIVVEVRALTDRLARVGDTGAEVHLDLAIPDTVVTAAWAGVLPPVSGWVARGEIDSASLAQVAAEGMERVAAAVPTDAGDPVVKQVRRAVWGMEIAPGIPASIAFAAEGLGFLSGADRLRISTSQSWTRFSGPHGHVVLRGVSHAA